MTTHDPHDPGYFDEAATRAELSRVFSVCDGCRRCLDLCTVFPRLVELLDGSDDRDPGRLTPFEQDAVVAGCHQCGRCSSGCPYAPELHDWSIDVPRLVLRARAMQARSRPQPVRRRLAARVLARRGPIGRRALSARPRSPARRLLRLATGISAERLTPARAPERFSNWFARRTPTGAAAGAPALAIVPGCMVEHHRPEIGRDLVALCERGGLDCGLGPVGCCGAPYLHLGDVKRFTEIAERNVRALDEAASRGDAIVVVEPICRRVVARQYPDHVAPERRGAAERIAALVTGPCELLVDLDLGLGGGHGRPARVALRASYGVGGTSATETLLHRLGVLSGVVEEADGIGCGWGLLDENSSAVLDASQRLSIAVAAGSDDDGTVVDESAFAATVIEEHTGLRPVHPISLVARISGIAGP